MLPADYAALTLDGRERPLAALRLACATPLYAERIEAIAGALDMPAAACLDYRDAARHVVKRASIEDGRLSGVPLADENADENAAGRRRSPPVAAVAPRGVVCNCLDFGEQEIAQAFAAGHTLREVQEKRKGGTSRGSCLSEVTKLQRAAGAQNRRPRALAKRCARPSRLQLPMPGTLLAPFMRSRWILASPPAAVSR